MTKAEMIAQEINSLLRLTGDEPLNVTNPGPATSEIQFLRALKKEYIVRLRQKIPKYNALPDDAIPDMFLIALRERERELETALR